MMGGWWGQQCQDSSFQEVKSVSSWFPWGCSTWELQLPAACIHKAEDGRAGKPHDIWQGDREREYIETAQKRHAVHYFICAVQRTSPSQQGNESGLYWEAQRWVNVRKSLARGTKWEVGTGRDKRLSFLLLKRSNMTYRGHERDDEIGQRKEIWRHTQTKGKQTE